MTINNNESTVSKPKNVATKKLRHFINKSKFAACPGDDNIDIEAFDKRVNGIEPNSGAEIKAALAMASLGNVCPQFKQPRVIRDNPKMAPPTDTSNYIKELKVKLSKQELTITWTNGTTNNVLCSPNPRLTPKGKDVVGYKCGPKHTNYKRDAMAWFTAFKSKGMVYGFHNSQRVGRGIVSHGCVRVPCEQAKLINQHSWSGVTKIIVVS